MYLANSHFWQLVEVCQSIKPELLVHSLLATSLVMCAFSNECVLKSRLYTLLLLSLVMIFLVTYWIFSDSKLRECSGADDDDDREECCSGYVYVCGAIFNVLQYVLYILSALYALVIVACVRGMHKVMNQ